MRQLRWQRAPRSGQFAGISSSFRVGRRYQPRICGQDLLMEALKGSCGHFGATRLAALCRKMEQIGMQDPVGDPVEVLRNLEAEADRVRVALEEEAKRISSTKSMMEESD